MTNICTLCNRPSEAGIRSEGSWYCWACRLNGQADLFEEMVEKTPDNIGMNVAKQLARDHIRRVRKLGNIE